MELKDLFDAIKKKTEGTPGASPQTYLSDVRKNLYTLTCQNDMTEATGDVAAFGGEKAVASDIGRAIVNLLHLAACLGVDPAGAIQIHATWKDIKESPVSEKRIVSDDAPKTSTAPIESQSKGVNANQTVMREDDYAKALMNSGSKTEADIIWKKTILKDEALSGEAKGRLSKVKDEVDKTFTSK